MKSLFVVVAMFAVLGFTGLASAKKAAADKGAKGTHGTVVSVNSGGNSFTMTLGKKDGGTTVTVDVSAASIEIDGKPAALADLLPGKHVSVVGTLNGEKMTATKVSEGGKHHKKKSPATQPAA